MVLIIFRFVLILDIAEREHSQSTPSGSSPSRAKGRGRKPILHKTCFRGREIVRITVLKATQSMLRSERIIRRKKRERSKRI